MRFVGCLVAGLLAVPTLAHAQWIPLPPPPEPEPGKPVDPWLPPPRPPEPVQAPQPPPTIPPPPAEDPPPIERPPRSPDEIPVDALPDATPDTPAPEPAGPTIVRYPLSLPMRPLLLPAGTASFDIGIDVGHFAREEVSVVSSGLWFGATFGFGATELSIDLSLHGFDSQSVPDGDMMTSPRVRSLSTTIRRLVAHETTIGTLIVLGNVGTEYQRFSPNLVVSRKAHLSDRAAIFWNTGVDYENAVGTDMYGSLRDFDRFGLFATLAVEASVSTHVSLYAGMTAHQIQLLDDVDFGYTSYRRYQTHLSLLIAASETLDVSFGWNIFSSGAQDSKSFSLSLTARRFR